MGRSAFEQLPDSQAGGTAAPETDYFSKSFFDEPGIGKDQQPAGGTPSFPRARSVINRIRANDLGLRGVPFYRDSSGDVAEVKDASGGPLSGFSAKTGIAYDSQGAPKQISYDETGPPKLSDPFERIPARTDPKTGAIEKNGPGGIYQYLGQDPAVTAKVAQAGADKDLSKESSLLGRKLTLDEHDLIQANKAQKDLHNQLTTAVPGLLDPKYHGADEGAVKKAIDDHFDAEYAAPEANKTAGWFSKDPSPETLALRADIDRRKALAHDTANKIFDVGDQMNELHASIETGRDKQRASVETLLAHHEGRSGPLDEQQPGEQAAKPGLYPPVADWGRMLGGGQIKPDQAPDMIKTAAQTGGVPAVAAPAAMAAAHDAADAQKKADSLRESNPTLADQFEAVAKGILEGVGNGVAELVKSPLGQGVTGLADIATLGALGMNPEEQTKKMAAAITAANPTIEKKLEGTVGRTIGNFAGGVLPFVAATIASGGAAPAVNAAMFFSSGYQHTLDDAKAHGASHLAAEGAALTNGSINAVLALPLGVVGRAYEAIFGDTAPKIVSRAIKNAYDTGGPGAVGSLLGRLAETIKAGGEGSEKLRQEAVDGIGKVMEEIKKTPAQRVLAVAKSAGIHAGIGGSVQTAQNLVSKTYNHDQGTFEGVPEQALGFGALAAVSEGFKQVADARKAKQALDIINSKGGGGTPPTVGPGKQPSTPPSGGAPALTEGGKASEVSTSTKTGKTSGTPAGEPARSEKPVAQPDNANAKTAGAKTGAEPAVLAPKATRLPEPRGMPDTEIESELKGIGYDVHRMPGEEFSLSRGGEPVEGPPKEARAVSLAEELGARHEADQTQSPRPQGAPQVQARERPTIDVVAHEAATSPKNGLPEPSQAQKEAGNYQKGHITVGGLNISIENPAGSRRKPEFQPLQSHYGYIKGTVGADKDHVDIFVKQGTPADYSGPVFVVNQHNQAGKFDEHKAVIGVGTAEEAKKEYLANYEKGWTGGKSVVGFKNPAAFKHWAQSGAKGQPATLTQSLKATEEAGAKALTPAPTKEGAATAGKPTGALTTETPAKAQEVVKKLVQGALNARKASLEVIGHPVSVKETTGDTTTQLGIGVNVARSGYPQILVDHAKLARETAGFSDRERSRTIQRAIDEEILHVAALKWEGKAPENRAKLEAWGKEADELGQHLSKAYSGWENLSDRQKGHEKVRAVLQKRWTGRLTETARTVMRELMKFLREIYDKLTPGQREVVDGVEAILKGEAKQAEPSLLAKLKEKLAAQEKTGVVDDRLLQQIKELEKPKGWQAPDTPSPSLQKLRAEQKPVTPQVPTEGAKYVLPSFVTEPYKGKNKAVAARAERRMDLAQRLTALIAADKIPATEQAIVTTLLHRPGKEEPSDKALAQAERKLAKYESTDNLPKFLADYWAKAKSGPEPTAFTQERLELAGLTLDQVVTAIEKAVARGVPESFILDRSKYTATKLAYEDIVNEKGEPNATTAGKQQSSEGGELSRISPRKDVRADAPEVRKEEGAKADAGGGPVDRGALPAKQKPSTGQSGQLDEKANKALDDAFEGLFAAKPIPKPPPGERVVKVQKPDGTTYIASFGDKFWNLAKGEKRASIGRLTDEGDWSHGMLAAGEKIIEGETLGAAKPQEAIPVEKLPKLITAAQELIRSGIDTPEKMASVLEEKFAGKARPFSQAFWDAVGIVRPDLRGTHDWETIYAPPQKKEEVRTPAENVTRAVRNQLLTGQSVDRRALTKLAEGNNVATKAADEAAEAAVVEVARGIAQSAEGQISPVDTYDKMVDLYNRQPNLTAKTSTSKIDQAYSTPAPLAYAASRLADIAGGKSVYEPTAGNGVLLIETSPNSQTVFANELNPTRLAALRGNDFTVTDQDATHFVPPEKVDRVIANPPFGTLLDSEGQAVHFHSEGLPPTNQIDQAIAWKALSAMKDDGRAVLIMGGKNMKDPEERAKAYARQDFWKALYGQYKVVDHFTVDGDLYAKQGAGWPVDIIVIAGRGKSPIQLPSADAPRIIGSWDGLRSEITRTDQERIEAGRYDAERDRERLGGIVGELRGLAATGERTGAEGNAQPAKSGDVSRGGAESPVRSDREPQSPAELPARAETSPEPATERAGSVGTGRSGVESEQRGPLGQFRVPYEPASKLKSFGIFIPTNMKGPAREALAKLAERVGSIDDFVRGKLGYPEDAPLDRYFSAEQMDALALGIDAIDGQTAFVLGDQGGVGKGRVAAGMMRYSIKAGKTPIFVTKDPKLYAAMIEDLHDIGSDDINPLFTNNDLAFEDYSGKKWSQGKMTPTMEEIERTGKLPKDVDVLFTTYDQIQSDVPKGYKPSKAERAGMKAKHAAPPDGPKMKALKRLAPGSIIISDESHLASGDSIRAWRLAPLLAQASGVYYSSATFAKRPDSMGIYSRTSLSHATQSMSDLVDAMKQGGVPLQQVVSATLASDGLYMRRERDFSHAVFRTHINIETRDRDVKLADNYTEGLRSILSISNKMKEASARLNKILRRQGKEMRVDNAPRIETTNFSSKLHNLVSQYLFAIKAEATVRRTVEGVTKGFTNVEGVTIPHKVVIAVQNTMEQPILALERGGRPLSFNGMLLAYLDSQRTLTSGHGPSAQTITITDKADPNFESLSDKQLQDALIVPNPEDPESAGINEPALAELFRRIMAGVFKETEAKLEALDLAHMPLSPIDHIRHQLAAAGVKSAEITKRGTGIDEDGVIYKISPNSNSKAAHLRYLNDFNNGDTQVLVMNASGSTGISAHASEKFKSREPRAMLIAQPHLDINEFVQTLYRIDRTGQVAQPYYELLQTALSAELRPAAILGRKMGSLNANTTSNAENEISTGNKGVDIFNQYGDEVVYNYLKSDSAFTDMLDMPKIMEGEHLGALEDVLNQYEQDGQFAAAVSGRVAVLPEEEASVFWEKVQSDYVALINYLNELGENELLADTIDLKAETLESKELTPAVKGVGRPSGFDQPSQLEKIKADIGSKPLPGSEVVEEMGKVNSFEVTSKWADRVEAWKKAELARKAEVATETWTEEKAAHYEARWREQEEEIRAALGLIGSGLHLQSKKGLDGYGAITDVHFDDEHPLTPSKQIFILAVNTTKKTLRIPASQLPAIARLAVGDFEKLYESTAERSNVRYMVTGNLLSAYLAIRDAAPSAKIVQYTTDQGEMRQGILMPSKFTPGALAKKRVVESPSHMQKLLDAGRALTNGDGSVTIVKPRGEYILRVPTSKIMGGAYWRDSQMTGLMEGGEFVERGGGMVGKISEANLPAVYKRLLELQTSLFFSEQDSETLGAGKPHKAPVAFYKEDMEEVARNIGLSLKESFTMLRHLVAPASDVNMEARDRAMKMLGERNKKAYETDRVLEAAREAFDKMPRPGQIAFIDKMKLGERQATPELQDLADVMRKIDTESWEAAQAAYMALGFKEKEVPLAWLENHYRVLWKKIPGGADKGEWIGRARRGLRGSMGQHKQHTLDTMSDGLAEGGIPYSYNPVVMFKLAQADLWKLTTTLKAWKWAKDTSYVQFVKGPFPKAPDGMVALDDSIAKVYFPADSGEGLISPGQYFVEDGFGRLLNNYLSFDHIRATQMGRGLIWIKNATTAMELSLSPFHAVFETIDAIGSNIGLGLQKLVNRGILGGNAKVAVDGLMDMIKAAGTPISHGLGKKSLGAQIRLAAANPTEFFKTADGKKMLKDYPRAREMIDDLFSGGWKPTELEQDWRTNSIRAFVDAVSDLKSGASDNYIGAGLRAFPAANEWLMRPLFDYYIPNLKVAQFFKEYAEALEQNERKLKGGILTRAALARQVWSFVEHRFGEMNYDTLFWNRTFKSAMQLMFRSVTWKLGSVQAFGGAFSGQAREFKDAWKEGRAPELHRNAAWLFGMMLLTSVLGTILMKSLTGKWPASYTDLVFPQIDPKDPKIRASLPTYFKDLVHLIHSPVTYVTSSMSGWIGRVADLLRNKDYYGVEIHDSDDSITKQVLDVSKYLGQTLLPFSIRGYKNLSTQDVGALRKAVSLLGVQPAPRFIGNTPAEQASGEYWRGQRSESGIRPEQQETKSEKRRLVAQIEHGDKPDIEKALATGAIKPRDIKPIYQRAQMGSLAASVSHMPLADAERIYRKANPSERDRLAPIMAKKRENTAKRERPAFSGF